MTEPRREHRIRPRKTPRQARSVETRARILAAAAEVFEAHGYDAGTTNRIAEAASLSVGSLYQYFPNKDAVLVELLEQHLADGAARVHDVLTDGIGRGATLPALVRDAIAGLLALHREAPGLHHVLITRTPMPPDLVEELTAHERHLAEDLARLLRALPGTTRRDPDRAARMVAIAVNGIVHAQIAAGAPGIDDATLVEEAATMVLAYLGTPEGGDGS